MGHIGLRGGGSLDQRNSKNPGISIRPRGRRIALRMFRAEGIILDHVWSENIIQSDWRTGHISEKGGRGD